MPMLKLSDLQAKVRELAATSTLLAGETVIADDGRQDEVFEGILATRGLVVIAGPVTDTTTPNQSPGAVVTIAEVSVEVWENPEKNPTGANKKPLDVISDIIAKVISYDPGPGELAFRCASSPVELLTLLPGLRGYAANFLKQVVIS